MKQKPNLFMFDLSSNFSRNYFKVKNLGNIPSDGYHNGVPVFAVKSTLFQVINEVRAASEVRGKPTHLLFVLDHDDDNFRHEIYPEYKANRAPKDEDFYIQREILTLALKYLTFSCIAKSGYEADDVIATISSKCSSAGVPLTIFTKDKDIFAMVDETTHIYSGQEAKFYDRDAVMESKGVPPEKITDMLILMGDKADNIFGVSGVGEKTAVSILSEFELLEVLSDPSILLNTKIRGKKNIVESIEQGMDKIKLMTEVATMRTDVELGSNLKDWALPRFPYEKRQAYDAVQYGFNKAMFEYLSKPRA
ncbi:53EXOc domain-containing protein [Vibrio chagasii]|nr:53EXOc domain-containing protein [Vibrio chagasii]